MNNLNIILTIIISLVTMYFLFFYNYGSKFSINDGLKIYFINMDVNKDRWEKCKNKLPNFHRFNAINGKELEIEKLRKYGILNESENWKGRLKAGTIGCALSHIKVMSLIKNQKEKYGLILEDDAIIPDNFISKLKNLEPYFPPYWDIIYLGGCNISGRKYNEKFLIPEIKSGHNYCCHAILFNKENVDKVINILTPIEKPIDLQLRSNFDKIKAYFVYPSMFFQNNDLISVRRILDGDEQKKDKLPNFVENINIIQ